MGTAIDLDMLSAMSDADAEAFVLQLEAISECQKSTTNPDLLFALHLFRQDIQYNQQIEHDRTFATSFGPALEINRPLIEIELALERQCQQDHHIAQQMMNGREFEDVVMEDPVEIPVQRKSAFESLFADTIYSGSKESWDDSTDLDEDTKKKFIMPQNKPVPPIPPNYHTHNNVECAYELIPVLASTAAWTMLPSSTASSSKNTIDNIYEEEKVSHCIICSQDFKKFRLLLCPCGHRHCLSCLRENLAFVQNNPLIFPPRCCEAIPLEIIAEALTECELRSYLAFHHEQELRDQRRCANKKCQSALLPQAVIQELGFCVACEEYTCTICGASEHRGAYPEDVGTQQLVQTAQAMGWAQCYNCLRVVEKSYGCFHMSCICGAHVWYICSGEHGKCTCAAAEEVSLLGGISRGLRKATVNFITDRFPNLSARQNNIFGRHRKEVNDEESGDLKYMLRTRGFDILDAREALDSALSMIANQKEAERMLGEQITAIREEESLRQCEIQLETQLKADRERKRKEDNVTRHQLLRTLIALHALKYSNQVKGKGKSVEYIVDTIVGLVESFYPPGSLQ